jgi:hypothetical protein
VTSCAARTLPCARPYPCQILHSLRGRHSGASEDARHGGAVGPVSRPSGAD